MECIHHKDVVIDDRFNLRIHVKLFLITSNYRELQKQMAQIFKYLEFNELDSLIFLIKLQSIRTPVCMADVYDIWSKLELYVKDHRILQLGVCDFTWEQLEDMW